MSTNVIKSKSEVNFTSLLLCIGQNVLFFVKNFSSKIARKPSVLRRFLHFLCQTLLYKKGAAFFATPFCLYKNNPNKFAYNMEQCVAGHSVNDAVLAVQPTEHKAKAAIKQKTAEKDQRCQLAKDCNSCRQVSGGKHKSRYDICANKYARRNVFAIIFSAKHLPNNECNKRHKEQAKQNFLYDTAVENGCDYTAYS